VKLLSPNIILLCFALLFAFGLSAEVQGSVVQWQLSSLRLVAEHGCYARIIRLKSGEILCCYQRKGEIRVKGSRDDSKSWGEAICVTSYKQGLAANPELLQLRNGRILLCYNERPDDGESPYGISIVFSDDSGKSWGKSKRIFEVGRTMAAGCGNSLFAKNSDTVTLISTTKIDGKSGIWAIDGKVVR